jgi:hypothetical protein
MLRDLEQAYERSEVEREIGKIAGGCESLMNRKRSRSGEKEKEEKKRERESQD